MKIRICPRCGKTYSEYPAISRWDNETEICSKCGLEEAIFDYALAGKENKKDKKLQMLLQEKVLSDINNCDQYGKIETRFKLMQITGFLSCYLWVTDDIEFYNDMMDVVMDKISRCR